MKRNIFIGGAHRGGTAITDQALQRLAINELGEIVVADPKEDRAVRLAERWKNAGVRAEPYGEPCEVAIDEVDVDVLMLSIDTIKPMQDVLARSSRPAQWQLIARGLGSQGPVATLAGTVQEGDSPSRESSKRLIGSLSNFIQPASSAEIRENPLNADILHSMRKKVASHSVSRLAMLDWEPKDLPSGSLNLFWGGNQFPLIVEERPTTQLFRETKQQALQAELPIELREVPSFAVATVAPRALEFFVIDLNGRGRSVRFFMPLIHSLPSVTVEPRRSTKVLEKLLGLGERGFFSLPTAEPSPAVVTD